ncbi:hypothetical protein E2I00_005705 [Balaenoptera physalus]|uniref:EamA domain-containing protein n=1 Tax=Balaenoptera physalus TaxID=9770 RepID=A0A643C3D1_BALPH|nr:hypothetical protein E2I00_005705 [Balaenoptera physalus]
MFYQSKDIKFREMGEENIVLCTQRGKNLYFRETATYTKSCQHFVEQHHHSNLVVCEAEAAQEMGSMYERLASSQNAGLSPTARVNKDISVRGTDYRITEKEESACAGQPLVPCPKVNCLRANQTEAVLKVSEHLALSLPTLGTGFHQSRCLRAHLVPSTAFHNELKEENSRALVVMVYVGPYEYKLYYNREMLISVALGQVLSLLICGISLTSKYLSEDFHANTPVFQSFLNYILLFLVYTTTLAVRQGEENLLAILRRRWWKYMILGLIDLEANYLVVKAYQYTTLTSIQLLDCFVIPVVILLSWFFLLIRYKAVHFLGIIVCILGMGCMAGADVLVGRHQGAGGATLYGISNVWEEYIIRTLSRVEFLGMIGLFGAFFSGIQLAIMEHKELLKVPWDWQIGLLYVGFSACMFGLYSFMPVVIKKTSATSVNLSLLTADLYSLFCGLFLFHYKVSGVSAPF